MLDPIAAVTHPDPYAYYADLAARRPMDRDATLGLWVAAGATAVTAALTSELCTVRPQAEPVPRALVGAAGGEVFGRLVRMTDGPGHAAIKSAVSAATARIEDAVGAPARRWAQHLVDRLDPAADPAGVTELGFRLPVYVLADLLGIAPELLPQVAAWVSDFVRCIAPGGTVEQLARGNVAAAHLMEMLRGLLAARPGAGGETLLADLARGMTRAGHGDRDVVAANGLGFLSQAYEATAGLIGNTLVALARHPEARAASGRLKAVIGEVVRFDPPVQNTRRFVARDGEVGGRSLKAGDVVLVVVAAANRDAAANPEPARFDPLRPARRAFTFGVGPHACPGEAVATTIAEAGVERLLACGVRPEGLLDGLTYRASANTRIPLFAGRR